MLKTQLLRSDSRSSRRSGCHRVDLRSLPVRRGRNSARRTGPPSAETTKTPPPSLGRSEGDRGAVGRKGRLPLIRRVLGELDRLIAADLPQPDVEVAFPAPVRSVGQQLTVRRKSRIGGQAGVGGQLHQGRSAGRGGPSRRDHSHTEARGQCGPRRQSRDGPRQNRRTPLDGAPEPPGACPIRTLLSDPPARASRPLCCWIRSVRSLRRQRRISLSSSGGASSIGAGSRCRMADSVDTVVSPVNARWPESISYRIAPNEKMSDRASTASCPPPAPATCRPIVPAPVSTAVPWSVRGLVSV